MNHDVLNPGEVTGSGSGSLVWYDESSAVWMSFHTDAEVGV